MKSISGRDFARLLEQRGWVFKRVNVSHHVYCKPGHRARISLPIHGNRPLKIGLLLHFMKVAGIDKREL